MLMKVRLETEHNVDYESIRDFVEEFPRYCQSCSPQQQRRPLTSPIWPLLNRTLKSDRFSHLLEEFKADRNFNVHDCHSDRCKTDVYDT